MTPEWDLLRGGRIGKEDWTNDMRRGWSGDKAIVLQRTITKKGRQFFWRKK